MMAIVLPSVVSDISPTVGESSTGDVDNGSPAHAVVGRVVDVHQHLHHGHYRVVVETGSVNMTVFSSSTAPTFAVGDAVAVAHIFNRWELARTVATDPTRWTGRRADGTAYLMTAADMNIDSNTPFAPAVLFSDVVVGTVLRTATDITDHRASQLASR